MNKFIEVYDDLLHPTLVDQIEKLLLEDNNSKVRYNYIRNITGASDSFTPAFSYNFIETDMGHFDPPHYFLSQIIYSLSHHLKFSIQNIILGRSFIQTPSMNPGSNSIHVDLHFPHWVCLYYVTDSDGDTILFDDNKNEIKRVSPKKGRIVFFDGSIKHCSSSPSKTTRSVINFDFLGEYLDKQK